ncbi:MAG: PilZ domain-containing protein, partial [Gammaproteobacteria bacterium]|nr:PilZ domain-containing protein [Gammaproteobacteria bacterium]
MDLNKKKNRSVDAPPQSHEPSGRERRAHERYALGLEARLSFRGTTGWRCAVRDFCVGGMSLALEYDVTKNVGGACPEKPGRGDIIDIECSAQSVGVDNVLNFSAQVVRRQGDGLAVRFLSPDLGALNILLDYAKSLSRQHPEHGSEVS